MLGAVAGWKQHSWLDASVIWLAGVLDSIPFYLFAAAVAFALQGHPAAMHLAMIVTFWTTTARIIRGEVMRIKEREFIEAAHAIGLPGLVTVFRHVLPNTYHILLVQGSIVFVAAINTEVILSFLGLGIQDGVSFQGAAVVESHLQAGRRGRDGFDIDLEAQVYAGVGDLVGGVGADIRIEASQEQWAAIELGHVCSQAIENTGELNCYIAAPDNQQTLGKAFEVENFIGG